MKITAHVLAKNEEKYIWYAVNSVLPYINEILIWDNGSRDNTRRIIESFKNTKIKTKSVPGKSLQEARQKMINETKSDWILVLDGDEIWSGKAMEEMTDQILKFGDRKDCIAVPNYMLIGDIFHYQEEKAGRYEIAGRVGNYNIRVVRNLPGLHIEGEYGNEAYVTGTGIKVQNLATERILFLNEPYFHASFLKKVKFEIGEEFPYDFYYPEVLFKQRPNFIPSPWKAIDMKYKLLAFLETPFKKIYRRTFLRFKKHGY